MVHSWVLVDQHRETEPYSVLEGGQEVEKA